MPRCVSVCALPGSECCFLLLLLLHKVCVIARQLYRFVLESCAQDTIKNDAARSERSTFNILNLFLCVQDRGANALTSNASHVSWVFSFWSSSGANAPADCVNVHTHDPGLHAKTQQPATVVLETETDLVVRAESALLALVSVEWPPTAVGLFAPPADHIHHAGILVRRAEPVRKGHARGDRTEPTGQVHRGGELQHQQRESGVDLPGRCSRRPAARPWSSSNCGCFFVVMPTTHHMMC